MYRIRPVFAIVVWVASALAGSSLAAQQGGVVTGTVIDARTRQGLAGARVTVPGTTLATTTNDVGRFRLERVPGAEATIRVIMVGYRAVTQAVRPGSEELQIVLTESPITIDEIVVTGTPGAAEKRALGNSVARIDAAEIAQTQPVSDIGNLLQGRAPGVAVTQQMGVAGGGARILLRGPGSLAFDGNPIVYVDGVRINNAPSTGPGFGAAGGAGAPTVVSRLNDISPQDIESIEVIRGPAAATLYGTQASAGVIQIITKRGRSGATRFSAQVRQGASWFNDAADRIPVPHGRIAATGEIVATNFVREEAAAGNPLFRTGHLQEYAAGLSGGTDAIRFYSGIEAQRDEGVIPVNASERYNGRLNLSIRPNATFDADLGLGVTKGNTSLYHALYFGSFVYGQPAFRNTASRGFLVAPVDAWANVYNYDQKLDRYQASLALNHRPTSWFSHRLSAGQDLADQALQILIPVVPAQYRPFFGTSFNRGSKSIDRTRTTYNTVDYSATATLRPGNRLRSSTSVGAQYYRTYLTNETLSGQEFPAPGVTTISGTAIRNSSEAFVEDVTVGLYAQQQLSWNDRFFLTGAIRADDNSAFGAEFDLVTYPKISASWVISEEPFWPLGFINSLKLRGAFGESGQQPSAFAAIRTYVPVAGEGDAPAATPQSPGNPLLGPERGREIELGFEASALDDRLGVDFTFYNRTTNDAILQRSVAPSSGYIGAQFINAGTINNRGIEVIVRGRPVATPNLYWDLGFNVAKNRNRIQKLGIDAPFLAVGFLPNRHQAGFPLDAYFRKRIISADLDPTTKRAVNILCDGGTGFQGLEPGGAGVPCSQAPFLYVGKPYHDWNGSVSSTITLLKRLTAGTVLDFRYGGQMFESLHWWNCSALLNHEILFYPERYDPKRVAECQVGLDVIGTTRIQNNGYTKLRELSLNYVLPDNLAKRFGARRAMVTVAGRNLYTWTGYDGLDPETFTPVNWLLSAHTELVMPLPRTVMATVNLEF